MHLLWRLFVEIPKKTIPLACTLFFLSLMAAGLEGMSFTLLLLGIASLTQESIYFPYMLSFFSRSDRNLFLYCFLAAIFFQILRSLSTYFGQLVITRLTVHMQQMAQKKIFQRLLQMSFANISAFKKGDLMHQAAAPPSFLPMLLDEYHRLIVAACMIAAYLLFMLQISAPLTGFILFFFCFSAVIHRFFFRKITKASDVQNRHLTDLSQQTAQCIDGLKAVHIFHRHTFMMEKIDKILACVTQATFRLRKLNALIPSMNECLGVIVVTFALLAGTYFLKNKDLPFAACLFTYLTLTYRLGTRLQIMMTARGMISYYSGPLSQLNAILAEDSAFTPTCRMSETTLKKPFIFLNHALEFENVSFRYPESNCLTLHNISMTIPKNKVVALVGKSGAGKSSLINLLLRLHSPFEGQISLDGHAIDSFSLSAWRTLFGVVPQDLFLFNESIAENILFGNLTASYEEMRKAAYMAGVDEFVQKLPEKYETSIGEKGYRLSGGEKQRIALAQALIRDPQVLILDEATSHLDSTSEKIIQQTLERLRHEKTLLIVAHRLSTIQMADLIFVMEEGKIVESGTHAELLGLSGIYRSLWTLQNLESGIVDSARNFTFLPARKPENFGVVKM